MGKPLRVVVVEDSASDTALLVRQLAKGGYDPTWERVDSSETLAAVLDKGPWDLLISDHSMPHFSALQALAALTESNIDIPVIILSGTIEEEEAVAAMRAGARDFIMKGDAGRLLPAIERELREARARQKARQLEEQFRQAQKMEAIGRLAGGVAHDFNNLLTAILGNCQFLLQDLDAADPRRKDVEDIKASADRAAALTRQLLAFSRRQLLEPRVIDLNSVIAGIASLLRRLIGEDIELVTIPGEHLAPVKADPGQIEQVIMNLAVNARDAMPNGGKLIIETANGVLDEASAGVPAEISPGPCVVLTISDTGHGMDDNVLAHLFEPFFTTKGLGRGTGLGLSTAYGIIKQSFGHIWVDSAPGKGTRFKICLPQAKDGADSLGAAAPPIASLRGTETVLLVEDDGKVRHLMQRILAAHGYNALTAADGVEALRASKERTGPIHLLVTDVVMPQMSGGELAREILKSRPDMKVLYVSGYTDNVITLKGIPKPGIHFLQKPFTPDALARKVRELLSQS